MGRLSGFTYRDISRKLILLGFVFYREAKGSHEIWHHPEKNLYTTLARHNGDVAEGTLRHIVKQAGVTPDDFLSA